jgi:hypothetical protein
MKDFRLSKTFKPYREIASVPTFDDNGRLVTKTLHYSWRTGYMSQEYKARLFHTAQESLVPGSSDTQKQLSDMANYLTTINVENYAWMVGSDIHQDPEEIQKAMQRMQSPEDSPYDPIHQQAAIRYRRFGNSALRLVRVPTMQHDGVYDPVRLPISVEVESSKGPEMLFGFSETVIRTLYPLPADR